MRSEQENREARRIAGRKWYAKNKEKGRAIAKRYQQAHPEKVRDTTLRRQYGITIQDYNRMREEQAEKCAICECIPQSLCVDHDHVSGEVRRLLCSSCNLAIGNLRDSSALAERAAAYLRRFQR